MIKIRKGTSIIEVIIATTLISIAIIAAMSLTNQSQKQNTYARGLAEATKYASQVVDWIRNERDGLGYETLYTVPDDTYCLNTLPADFLSMQSGACDDSSFISNTNFRREANITKSVDAIGILVTVSWIDTTLRQAKIEMELKSWH